MVQISASSTVCQSEDHVSAELDGEVVLMSIEKGAYFGLNKVLSRIWKLIETPITVNQLCAALMAEYEVDAEICQKDVIEALQTLAEKNLVAVS